MPKLRTQLSSCKICNGEGKNRHQSWVKWWEFHKEDWKEAITYTKNVPDVPEYLKCELCHGSGRVPPDDVETRELMCLLDWMIDHAAANGRQPDGSEKPEPSKEQTAKR